METETNLSKIINDELLWHLEDSHIKGTLGERMFMRNSLLSILKDIGITPIVYEEGVHLDKVTSLASSFIKNFYSF